jgi:hypothetical protein
MTHKAKLDVCLLATIAFGVAVVALGANRWIAGSVLVALMLCAYPQSYVTTADALEVHAGVSRSAIPYSAITFLGPEGAGRVRVQYGVGSQLLLAPEDPAAFLSDIAKRAPHLMRRGPRLVAALV